MLTPRYRAVLTGLALAACTCARAQMPAAEPNRFNPRFEIFTLPGGEAANQVQYILQDKVGFLWFASRGGLIRYDGRHFTTYRSEPGDSNTIAENYIRWIFQDSRGILWLAHANFGVSAFNPVTEKCVRYRFDNPDEYPRNSANCVQAIVEDRQGRIWIGRANGLCCLTPPAPGERRGKIKNYYHKPDDPRSLSSPFVQILYVDRAGTLWVGCGSAYLPGGGGLDRFDPDQDRFIRCASAAGGENDLKDDRVQVIAEDRSGHFWVGTAGEGLYQMEVSSGRFTRFVFDPRHPEALCAPVLQRNRHLFPEFQHTTFISEDQQGRIWTGAVEGGLNVYDPVARATRHFEQAVGQPDSLQTISPWCFCQTWDGSIWIACGDNGPVFRVQNTNNLFPFYSSEQCIGYPNTTICGLQNEGPDRVWLQTVGDFTGVVRFDRAKDQRQYFRYNPGFQQHIMTDQFDLGFDAGGTLWAGTAQGLYRWAPGQSDERHFQRDSALQQTLGAGNCGVPFSDGQGHIWVAAYGRGLYRFDSALSHPQLFQPDPNDPKRSLGGLLVNQVFRDKRQNRLWVLGGSAGYDQAHPMFFDRFDPVTEQFEHFLPYGVVGNITACVEDSAGNFWFTAFPYGLRKLNPQDPAGYREFKVTNSALATNLVTDMFPGPDGHIWLLAKGAIIRLNPQTETFFTYSAHHGVRTGDFNWFTGACQAADGAIFYGGRGGFHAFYPREIDRLAARYPAVSCLTDLKVMDERVVPDSTGSILKRPIWETTAIELPYDRNVFSFQVSTLEFGGPEWSQLEYKLEKYDRGWRRDLRDGEAAYVQVPPGHYVFRVRGLNSFGIPVRETVCRVVITPPWWRTWWAYALFVLLIAAAVYALYRFQLKRKLEHAETLRLLELDTVKSRLYANITHEFRTPLTLLLGPTERLLHEKALDEETRGVLQTVQRNAGRLLILVNQLLDLAKLESGKLTLHYTQGEVLGYLKYLLESFHSLAEQKNIRLHFLTELDALVMDFDAEKLQQIVSNLLSNSLKFTPENGQVYLSAAVRPNMGATAETRDILPAECLALHIRDTGVGIPEDKLPFIFDRFYQVDDSHTRAGEGTGIGLALTRELVKLMDGVISVKSQSGQGTTFEVLLPIHREAPVGAAPPVAEPPLPTAPLAWLSTLPEADAETPLVLLVEDNADVVAYLATCLPNYRLLTAKNGAEGLESAIANVPDIVISDVMMPRMDGFELCRRLKNDNRTSHIPVILLTAKADLAAKLEGLEQGADVYLAKPFHREELLLHIRILLENRRRLQQYYLQVAGLTDLASTPDTDGVPANPMEDHFVQQVRIAVEARLDDCDFDVEQLCRTLALSHSQLHRKLSALTGFSANRFIRTVRLNRAKELLLDPNLKISAVAYDCGFNDPAYFSRAFKQAFGLTPQTWREEQKSP